MAKQRMVNTSFWSDNYILDLDPAEKLLFLFFITNEKTDLCGMYEIHIRTIAMQTGYDKNMIEKIIDRFSRDGKIFYIDGWIWIRNFQKHQNPNESIKKGIERTLESIPVPVRKKFDHIEENIQGGYTLSTGWGELKLNLTKLNFNLTQPNGDFKKSEIDDFDSGFIENKKIESTENPQSNKLQEMEVLNIPSADSPAEFGDHGINEIIRAITEAHGTIDGTVKSNRIFGKHLKTKLSGIKGFDGRYYEFIYMICTQSDQYRISKTTSCKLIYDNLASLIANLKTSINPKKSTVGKA